MFRRLLCALRGYHQAKDIDLRENGIRKTLELQCSLCGARKVENFFNQRICAARVIDYRRRQWKFHD